MSIEDYMVLAGAGAVSAGVALVYVPAGIVVAGAFLLTGGVLMARARANTQKGHR